METLDEVWAGDLFDRQREAVDLVGYLESVAGRPLIREDGHAHVMAIDTAYGHGKTFFLRRLDRHLKSTEHVSAYIDAWVDDLEDQPMVALAATLDRALEPWAAKSPALASGLRAFKSKAGSVAKIVGVGLAKRGVGFLITQGAADALSDELTKASETTKDFAKDALKEGGKATVDDVATEIASVTTPSMDARIKRFHEGQAAIQEMKDSLAVVVEALSDAGMKLPITIIVDELDRCRPTYAIKVLEEIKHLFDVQGVAFLLGLHGGQLEHSVTAAYGQGFDGSAYLRRFFSRRYSLRPASLQPLVQHLIQLLGLNENLLAHPAVMKRGKGRPENLPSAEIIADYLLAYGLAARDAFGIMDSIQTAVALASKAGVQLVYLLPLIISRHLGKDDLNTPQREPNWKLAFSSDPFGRAFQEYSLSEFVARLHNTAQMTDSEIAQQLNSDDIHAQVITSQGFRNSSSDYHLLQNYPELVRTVGRFS